MKQMDFLFPVVWPPAGRYVVAVSGGVDSVALLDLLVARAGEPEWELVAAHFNHGWPGDDAYEEFARRAIERYGLGPVIGRAQTKRTEADARTARYGFLRQVMRQNRANGIITAHHQDDVEETMLLNLLRGTGRRGLAPFERTPDVLRPLVGVRKADLKKYAGDQGLEWCHDTYNDDLKFRRNQVRHELIPRLERSDSEIHERLMAVAAEAGELNAEIDAELRMLFEVAGRTATADRPMVRRLDLDTLSELLLAMVRAVRPGTELSRRTVRQLAVDLKIGRLAGPRQLANSLFASRSHDTVTIVFTP